MQMEEEVGRVCVSAHLPQDGMEKTGEIPSFQKEWEQSPREKGGPSPRPFQRRTPLGAQRNCNTSFKSPVPSLRVCQPADKETLQWEIEELKNKSISLDKEIAPLLAEGYSLEELENHIALLHEYNEIKDTGQMLLGRLAVIRGVTTKELYPEFGLDLND
nr:DNA repair protein SWI5 homolog isoform X1 [Anolis sagrei ordinatus]